jgi:hypothetical protein
MNLRIDRSGDEICRLEQGTDFLTISFATGRCSSGNGLRFFFLGGGEFELKAASMTERYAAEMSGMRSQ